MLNPLNEAFAEMLAINGDPKGGLEGWRFDATARQWVRIETGIILAVWMNVDVDLILHEWEFHTAPIDDPEDSGSATLPRQAMRAAEYAAGLREAEDCKPHPMITSTVLMWMADMEKENS